ncbi:thermonuclease family protein [Bacillus cereus]|uniref:thermonuclease family protein n=1 Tax=Bacillus cereus group TaxID=86661 RepID=UPI0011C9B6EC|nr:thermonuclease family protein [Bacillus sp. AR18-7]TXR64537.1 nuclease [Bacillus sp. AR18-7]
MKIKNSRVLKILSITAFSCIVTACINNEADIQKSVTGKLDEESIANQTGVLTGLAGEKKSNNKKVEMNKPETIFYPEMPKYKLKEVKVDTVLSSNTIKTTSGEHFTLIGVQTEPGYQKREFVEFLPDKCQKYLSKLLSPGSKVYIEEVSGDEENEAFGYVWIGNNKELKNVNALLIKEGLGKLLRIADVTLYDSSFYSLEQEAYKNRIGIWENFKK